MGNPMKCAVAADTGLPHTVKLGCDYITLQDLQAVGSKPTGFRLGEQRE